MAELDTTVSTETATGMDTGTDSVNAADAVETAESVELARIRAEMAKLKAANDKLSKENSEKTKQLRAKQSAEEVAAEEAKALQQSMQEELEQLRKEKAVGIITAKAMSFIGDEAVAAQLGEDLYGSADADAALTAIQKAWMAREKALRLEYGKIPPPGAGGSDGPSITREQLDSLKVPERVKFAKEHPDEYNRLMGR